MSEISEVQQHPDRPKLKCGFDKIDAVFDECMEEARLYMSEQGIEEYLEGASLVCMMGRGVEPVLSYMEDMPAIAGQLGQPVLKLISETVWEISRTPNGQSIPAFLDTIAAVSRRLADIESLQKRTDAIVKLCNELKDKSHIKLYADTKEIREHNQKIFFSEQHCKNACQITLKNLFKLIDSR